MQGDQITLVLLIRSEMEWLTGAKQISSAYERQLRSRLNRKLSVFQNLELPLLMRRRFNVTTGSHSVTAGCRGEPKGTYGQEISDVNIDREANALNGRGSPSLVGRGIANPMSERTRGFKSHSPRHIHTVRQGENYTTGIE